MRRTAAPATVDDLIQQLGAQARPAARARLIAGAEALHGVATVERLADEATRLGRIDLRRAGRLAAAGVAIASGLGDAYADGRAARASGHVEALAGDWPAALAHYELALARFDAAGRDVDAAITRSGALQTLIYLGRYAEAHAWADQARATFERHGDRLRLARLESNLGNVFYRQDRFEDALASYERALAAFSDPSGSSDVAITLRNVAVCQISLQRFEAALETYAEARAWCERHGLVRLVAEVDYNIAYLHYLRGEYARAMALYATARSRAAELDDGYHAALCDLDEAELYLELNLVPEGAALARRAANAFGALGMRYEQAKALTSLAFAASRERNLALALRRFDDARAVFVREGNRHWPALIDLSKALVLERAGHADEAGRLCRAARRHFAATPLTARTALCDLLQARMAFARHDDDAAGAALRSASTLLSDVASPALRYQARALAGRIAERRGDPEGARAAYREAHAAVETLRSQLDRDELKVAFLDDKHEVFAALADLALRHGGDGAPADAFAWVELAKSRSLAEQVALHAGPQVRARAQHLTALLHQQREEGRRPEPAAARLSSLEAQARRCDGELAAALGPAIVPLEDLLRALEPGVRVIEYADVRGTLHAWVLGADTLRHAALAPAADIRSLVRLLHFQLAAREARAAVGAPAPPPLAAHLRALYDRLLRPLEPWLAGASHLVVVPHDALHRVPFHALDGGDGPVVDRVTVAMAPSASVHHHAGRDRPAAAEAALVLAVPDPLAPAMADEATRVGALLGGARLAVGTGATRSTLVEHAPRCRVVHIAAHGRFRRDNPMYSSVKLDDGEMTVRDLAGLHLSADLVTLSGCGTGLSVATGGDELLGLARALLWAGARSVLVSLWDVHDQSAVALMERVYQGLAQGETTAQALRHAMLAMRSAAPDPFHWAPFLLVGSGSGRISTGQPASPHIFSTASRA